jgi:cephalosporin-C deacetylase
MPLIDLPLSKLKTYKGRNPKPANFDAYWKASLAELDATDPDPKWVPNETIKPRGVSCFDLWYTGVRGARIHAKFLVPDAAEGTRLPAVLQFHGYSGNSGEWNDKLALASQGFVVAAMDCRGQGGLSDDPGGARGNTLNGQVIRGLDDPDPTRLLFRDIFLDTAQLARIVLALPYVDPKRVGATGGSQGGALTLACAALEPRIRRAAPVFPFLCDYQRVWEMDLAKDAYHGLRDYFRLFDPRHEREEAVFTKLGYIDCQHLAPRIKAETLLFVGLMDTICPPSSQFAAFNRIRAPKRTVIYPDFGHEHLPGSSDRIFEFMRGL